LTENAFLYRVVWPVTQPAYKPGPELSAGWPFSINQGPKSADVNKCKGNLVVGNVTTTVTITAIATAGKQIAVEINYDTWRRGNIC